MVEQKFLSRIEDRRRALAGRSAIESAIARAVPLDAPEQAAGDPEDRAAAVEQQVIARTELRRLRELIAELTRDQQLVLASQALVDMGAAEFCSRHGWSSEKYRKVAQRARARLRVLAEEYERGERCSRLRPEILAASVGEADEHSLARARVHLSNCRPCALMAAHTGRQAPPPLHALLPPPLALAASALAARLSGAWSALRRLLWTARHPLSDPGGNGLGAAGSSVASISALKVTIAAACVAGAAGGYAVCSHLGGIVPPAPHHAPLLHTARAPARRPRRHAHSSPATTTTAASVATTQPPHTTATTAARPRRSGATVSRRLTAAAQIRREFGVPPARAAASAATTTTTTTTPRSPAGAAAASTTAPAATTPAQSRQIASEFGFER